MTTERNESTNKSLRIPESSTSTCDPLTKASTSVTSRLSFADLSSMPIEIKEMIVSWIYFSGGTGVFNDSRYATNGIVLLGDTIKSLTTLQPIVQRHSRHVKWLYWRASYGELYEQELVEGNPENWDENTRLKWDPKTRSELLLKVLQACTRLDELNIDLDPFEYITDDPSPDTATSMWCYDEKMMNNQDHIKSRSTLFFPVFKDQCKCSEEVDRSANVTAWLQDRVWPNLKEFNVCHTNGFESIHTLRQLAAKYGVTMCLNGNIGDRDDHSDEDSHEEDLSESDEDDTGKEDLEILNEIENENIDGVKDKKDDEIEDEKQEDDTPEQIQDVLRMWTHGSDYEEEVEISDPSGWNQPDFYLSDSFLFKSNVI
ncbi:uncharacterized protein MELLADRAFT_103592 [Melampsora larici-populina 98AG31]|uniref:Uncharacterized protein n=1 Tax=Melampsora larici-populina (strain 98AG31 / pathotype 3-4-7) TaxID=747676 RepID=F4RBU7_MELLP|nr:uncharacterized protein MELLADRAFT_103592 [Melampsora larici-populina 98AG31]EGG10169.1 hypothetical protein MELLADRAFT_103592 [Melampsora larici-populina 98AG31]